MTGVERKLAAILSADVVGYSRLMAEDEAATVDRVTAYREQIGALVVQHRGRLVDFTGDNFLAEFPTATDAVEGAAEIQRVIKARNAALPDEQKMEFRVGVHLGEVRVEGDRLYGDGVNIAARLEGLAETGGICISDDVLHQVQGKLELDFEDLGEQSVKNIPNPVHAYRVRVDGGAAVLRAEPKPGRLALLAVGVLLLLVIGGLLLWSLERGRPAPAEAPRADGELTVPGFSGAPAIAVLPFNNLSGDPEQEYFADGIAEDLITRLSSWRQYPVIARNSSFTYKGKAVDVKQVSRELGVRYVVEGSVRRAGDRVRISAQLIDATTGHHVWAETYDRELRDVFTLQDEITQAILAAMGPQLWQSEQERAVHREPRNLAAWELSLQGFSHADRRTKDENATARTLFERAAELDPGSTPALWGLAMTHYNDLSYGWTDAPARSVAEIERLAKQCVALDESAPFCQMTLFFAHHLAGRRDEALAALDFALRMDPSYALAYTMRGGQLAVAGRPEEAIADLETAMRLTPRDPDAFTSSFFMGFAHFAAGRYDAAVEWLQRSRRQNPSWFGTSRVLASSYAQLDRLEEAREALDEARRLEPGLSIARIKLDFAGADPSVVERYFEGLRKAGLKEE